MGQDEKIPTAVGWDPLENLRVPTSFQRECGNTLFGGRPGLSGDPESQLRDSTGLAPVSPLGRPVRVRHQKGLLDWLHFTCALFFGQVKNLSHSHIPLPVSCWLYNYPAQEE